MPGRKPLGDRPMTAAERQARFRAAPCERSAEGPLPEAGRPAQPPAALARRRGRAGELQEEYRAWRDNLPDNLPLVLSRTCQPRCFRAAMSGFVSLSRSRSANVSVTEYTARSTGLPIAGGGCGSGSVWGGGCRRCTCRAKSCKSHRCHGCVRHTKGLGHPFVTTDVKSSQGYTTISAIKAQEKTTRWGLRSLRSGASPASRATSTDRTNSPPTAMLSVCVMPAGRRPGSAPPARDKCRRPPCR